VKCEVIDSLKNSASLETLHVGHIEHGDTNCDELSMLNPAEGLFMVKIM